MEQGARFFEQDFVSRTADGNHYAKEPRKGEPTTPLPWLPAFIDGDELPAQEWAVVDRIPLREVCLYSGEGAAGKSITGLHLCAAHALGQKWLNMDLVQGGAWFIDAEDDVGVLHRRLDAVRRHYDTTFAAMEKGGLKLMSLRGRESVMAIASRNTPMTPTPLYHQLLEAAAEMQPKMIVIASLANIFAGVEFDRPQVQQFIGLMTKLATTANGSLVLISHPSLAGISSDSGISGSTQWHNAVRARMYLKTIKAEADPEEADQQANSDLRLLEFRKNQYGPVSTSLTLRWKDGLFQPETMTSADIARKRAIADDVFNRLMHLFAVTGTRVGTDRNSRTYGPNAFAKEAEARNNGVTKRDLEDAMHRGIEASKYVITTHGPPSKEVRHLVIRK